MGCVYLDLNILFFALCSYLRRHGLSQAMYQQNKNEVKLEYIYNILYELNSGCLS